MQEDGLKKREDYFFLEIVFLFLVPPSAFYLLKTNSNIYLLIFFLAFVLLLSIIIREKISFNELGLTKKYLVSGFVPYLLFTVVGVLGIRMFAREFGFEPYQNWWSNNFFLALFIPISMTQEFAYRSFLIPGLKRVFNDATTVVLVNAGLFAILHLFYPEPALVLPLAFAGGLGFATLYYLYPNFWLVSASHIILNFYAVSSGFFVITS